MPFHVSEYGKPSALWIYHDEGNILLNKTRPQIHFLVDNWFKFGYRGYIGKLYAQMFEQMPLAFVYAFGIWHDATKASFILEGYTLDP